MIMNNELDNLTIYAKKEKVNEIISHYSSFGWIKVSEKDNNTFEDLVDITFQRKHKIKNKDELQLLQVHLEDKLNELGKAERHKHSKLTALALCCGVFGLIFIAFGVLCCIGLIEHVGIIVGIISFTIALLLFTLGIITLPKVYKLEIRDFNKLRTKVNGEISKITKKAMDLLGGANGQDN